MPTPPPRLYTLALLCALGALSLASCSDDAPAPADDAQADADTGIDVGPDTAPSPDSSHDADVAPEEPIPSAPALLGAETPRFAARTARSLLWVGATDEAALGFDGERWWWLEGDDELPLPAEHAPALTAAETASLQLVVTDAALLVTGPHGVAPVTPAGFQDSPLTDRFAHEPVRGAAADPDGGAVWFSTSAALYRWVGGLLSPLSAEPAGAATLTDSLLAAGSAPERLWLGGQGGLFAVDDGPNGLMASLVTSALVAPDALGADAAGTLLLLHDGDLVTRTPGAPATWQRHILPSPATHLASHPLSASAWIALADGSLIRHFDGALLRAEGLPLSEALIASMAMTSDGRALIAHAEGLLEVQPERHIGLTGLLPEAALSAPTPISLRISDPAEVTTIEAAIHDASGELALTLEVQDVPAAPRLSLDPLALPNGPFELRLSVTWSDDETRSRAIPFSVAYPTWTADVQPVFIGACASCHSDPDGAALANLATPTSWSSRIGAILCRVDRVHGVPSEVPECAPFGANLPSTMPVGSLLDAASVNAIRGWRDGGFRD